jgi:hypothetical protein
MKGVLA